MKKTIDKRIAILDKIRVSDIKTADMFELCQFNVVLDKAIIENTSATRMLCRSQDLVFSDAANEVLNALAEDRSTLKLVSGLCWNEYKKRVFNGIRTV